MKSFFTKLLNKIKQFFKRKPAKQKEVQQQTISTPTEARGYTVFELFVQAKQKENAKNNRNTKPRTNNKNFEFTKKSKHKFKNVDPDDIKQLEEIQKTAGNSCDEKIRREQIKKARRAKLNPNLKFVGKLSLSAKKHSMYRHALKTKEFIKEKKVEREEREVNANYYDTMYAQENPTPIKTVEKNSKPTSEKPPVRRYKEKHVGITLNLSDYIK